MSSAKVTLIGLYQYDNTLFDNLVLPDNLNNSLLIDTILMRGGDYEVIYPNAPLLKQLIGSWCTSWGDVFSNWNRAKDDMKDIAPLENYDRIEEWSDNESTSESSHGSSSTSGSDSSSASESMSERGDISAFDSNGLVANDGGSKSTQANNTATTYTTQGNDLSSNGSRASTHGGRIHGNIGVTTAAQMYQSFYEVMAKYGNIYDAMATIFLQSFVIPLL